MPLRECLHYYVQINGIYTLQVPPFTKKDYGTHCSLVVDYNWHSLAIRVFIQPSSIEKDRATLTLTATLSWRGELSPGRGW